MYSKFKIGFFKISWFEFLKIIEKRLKPQGYTLTYTIILLKNNNIYLERPIKACLRHGRPFEGFKRSQYIYIFLILEFEYITLFI
jgi:hypothetical protein